MRRPESGSAIFAPFPFVAPFRDHSARRRPLAVYPTIMEAILFMDDSLPDVTEAALSASASHQRVAELVQRHHDFVWRSLRRLGVHVGDVDDAAQHVFLIAARKLDAIRSGCEASYLYQTALRIASDYRKSKKRHSEVDYVEAFENPNPSDTNPSIDEMMDMRRARAKLDAVLDAMPTDLRAVFVLHDIEQVTMAEIAELLDVPSGTVASRLRRARKLFFEIVERKLGRAVLGDLVP
jgi:RNA polymerase sigma-70 factor (ECF subfamily)